MCKMRSRNVMKKTKIRLNIELDISVSLTENFFFQNATILKISILKKQKGLMVSNVLDSVS